MRFTQRLAHLIAPPVCLLCGANGQSLDETWGLDLCACCEAACPLAAPEPPPFDSAFCLFRYEDPVDLLIQRLKFRHDLAVGRALGILFARAWRAADRPLPQCVVPMPLHRSRYRERGFCQTTCIARHVARRLPCANGRPLPVRPELLRRIRATQAQSGLSAASRARNLQGAFATPLLARPPRHVALLDDVLTTGNTALAAIATLRAAGVAHVELWCCARALRLDGGQAVPVRVSPPSPSDAG